MRRATYAIVNGRTLGASAVKLIHGYGSSGKGGKIRLEVRAYLERQKARGKIRDYIPGERFSIIEICTDRLFRGDAFSQCAAGYCSPREYRRLFRAG